VEKVIFENHKYYLAQIRATRSESSRERKFQRAKSPGSVLKITNKYYLAQIRATRSESSKVRKFQGATVPYMEFSLPGANGLGSEKSSYPSILVPSSLASVSPYHLHVRGAASADSSRTCSESRFFSSAILPQEHVHVSQTSYIDLGDNFNFGELCFWPV